MKKKIIFFVILLILILGIVGLLAHFNNKDTKQVTNSENTSSETVIEIDDKIFLNMLEDIYLNYGEYEGEKIAYEGFIHLQDEYKIVGRNYACCGDDGYIVGFECESEDIVAHDQWVRVEGIVRIKEENGSTYPYIEAEKVIVLEERGLDTLY